MSRKTTGKRKMLGFTLHNSKFDGSGETQQPVGNVVSSPPFNPTYSNLELLVNSSSATCCYPALSPTDAPQKRHPPTPRPQRMNRSTPRVLLLTLSLSFPALAQVQAEDPRLSWEQSETSLALMNGEQMSIREKGPFWVIYPMSEHAELREPAYNDRLIWQLRRRRRLH